MNLIENDRWFQIYQIKNESSERKRVDPTCITFYQISLQYWDGCQPIRIAKKVWNQDDKMSRDDE